MLVGSPISMSVRSPVGGAAVGSNVGPHAASQPPLPPSTTQPTARQLSGGRSAEPPAQPQRAAEVRGLPALFLF